MVLTPSLMRVSPFFFEPTHRLPSGVVVIAVTF